MANSIYIKCIDEIERRAQIAYSNNRRCGIRKVRICRKDYMCAGTQSIIPRYNAAVRQCREGTDRAASPGVPLSRQYDGILLEDLGNLLANELFSPDGAKQNSVKSILSGMRKLKENCKTLVVVSNEIFSDGEAYPPETMEYIRMLAELHVRITQEAGAVFESVCGILLPIKGGFEV